MIVESFSFSPRSRRAVHLPRQRGRLLALGLRCSRQSLSSVYFTSTPPAQLGLGTYGPSEKYGRAEAGIRILPGYTSSPAVDVVQGRVPRRAAYRRTWRGLPLQEAVILRSGDLPFTGIERSVSTPYQRLEHLPRRRAVRLTPPSAVRRALENLQILSGRHTPTRPGDEPLILQPAPTSSPPARGGLGSPTHGSRSSDDLLIREAGSTLVDHCMKLHTRTARRASSRAARLTSGGVARATRAVHCELRRNTRWT